MLELADPLFLLVLPLPLLVIWLCPPAPRSGSALEIPRRIGEALLTQARSGPHASKVIRATLPWLAWACFVVALAGPRSVAPVSALKVSGRDMAIVLDLSGSMVREDFFIDEQPISRLDAVKKVGASFARRRAGDRVALIFFGSQAYYAAPFSFDTEAVARRIEGATIGISGRATNISDGLGLAVKRLAKSEADTRVVILLSDGKNNAGATNPIGVAELAASLGIRVHTIAMGPKDLASAETGERGVVDAATLLQIAQATGGESFRVRTLNDLENVSTALDKLEATDSEGLAAEVFHEHWVWVAAVGAALCLGMSWKSPA